MGSVHTTGRTDLGAERRPALAVRPAEAAVLLGVSRAHLYRLLRSGEIPSARAGRVRLVPVASLEAWLEKAAS